MDTTTAPPQPRFRMTTRPRRQPTAIRETRQVRTPRPSNSLAPAAVVALPVSALPRSALRRSVLLAGLRRIAEIVALWRERVRSRSQLLRLDEALLKDIGISRADVEREAMKPFWRT